MYALYYQKKSRTNKNDKKKFNEKKENKRNKLNKINKLNFSFLKMYIYRYSSMHVKEKDRF